MSVGQNNEPTTDMQKLYIEATKRIDEEIKDNRQVKKIISKNNSDPTVWENLAFLDGEREGLQIAKTILGVAYSNLMEEKKAREVNAYKN